MHVAIQSISPLTVHGRPHRQPQGCGALSVTRQGTLRNSVRSCCITNHLQLQTATRQMISFVSCGIGRVLVFVATDVASAPTAEGVTPSVPAPSRLADSLPINQHAVHIPLRPQVFAGFLADHPDKTFVSKLIKSLTSGFDIGYFGPHTPMVATNLRSASDHTEVIDEALQKELANNHMAGPYTNPPYPNLRCSGVGVVPKKDGSWRLI